MITGPANRIALLRRYYESYETDDREALQGVLHQDFTFSSPAPEDDRLGQVKYFQRCWPQHERITKFDLLDISAVADSALVRYIGRVREGSPFHCVDQVEFQDDLILKIECYFGRDLV
jgi:ketosteroid isomerase-like protein